MPRSCPRCGGNNFEQDSSHGTIYCDQCGTVVEENAIVSEVAFGESSSGAAIVQGSFVAANQTHVRTSGLRNQNGLESREQTLVNGRRRIIALAHALHLPDRQAEAASRWFTLAVSHNFVQGRRSQYVVASCLYVVCRQEKTSHMLIDFSDILHVNVFILGATFLKLVRCLNLKLPIVDPSLYISRFAAMLEFGLETQRVASDAIRLVQRMDRDWIQQGRRPAGICGACLVLAARMNNFRRSIAEVVHVVKVADMTVQKRLQEFKSTASSDLTVDQFRNVWIEQGNNPPSFDHAKRRKRGVDYTENIGGVAECSSEKGNTLIDPLDGDKKPPNLSNDDISFRTPNDKRKSPKIESDNEKLCGDDMEILKEITETISRDDLQMAAEEAAKCRKIEAIENSEICKTLSSNTDQFSDLDDEELDSFILDENESYLKTKVWMEFNRDFLAAQEAKRIKREVDEKAGIYKPLRKASALLFSLTKRRRPARPRDSNTVGLPETPAESAKQMLQQRAFSKKINYAALDHLFDS